MRDTINNNGFIIPENYFNDIEAGIKGYIIKSNRDRKVRNYVISSVASLTLLVSFAIGTDLYNKTAIIKYENRIAVISEELLDNRFVDYMYDEISLSDEIITDGVLLSDGEDEYFSILMGEISENDIIDYISNE